MTRRPRCWLVLTIGLVVPALAGAQARPPVAEPGGVSQRAGAAAEGNGGRRLAIELANALDQFAIVQARRALQLTEAQYSRVVPRLKVLQQTRRRNQQGRHRLLQELRRMVGPRAAGEPDEAAVLGRLSALREHDERAAAELRAAYAALDEVLDPRQQARFRVFEENIEARKLELLMRARARAGPRSP